MDLVGQLGLTRKNTNGKATYNQDTSHGLIRTKASDPERVRSVLEFDDPVNLKKNYNRCLDPCVTRDESIRRNVVQLKEMLTPAMGQLGDFPREEQMNNVSQRPNRQHCDTFPANTRHQYFNSFVKYSINLVQILVRRK